MRKVFRHGDLVLREVKTLPKGKAKRSIGFSQSGETGKMHVLPKTMVIAIDYRKFLKTPADGDTMTHPQHPPLDLPADTMFEVTRVRSVTPYTD